MKKSLKILIIGIVFIFGMMFITSSVQASTFNVGDKKITFEKFTPEILNGKEITDVLDYKDNSKGIVVTTDSGNYNIGLNGEIKPINSFNRNEVIGDYYANYIYEPEEFSKDLPTIDFVPGSGENLGKYAIQIGETVVSEYIYTSESKTVGQSGCDEREDIGNVKLCMGVRDGEDIADIWINTKTDGKLVTTYYNSSYSDFPIYASDYNTSLAIFITKDETERGDLKIYDWSGNEIVTLTEEEYEKIEDDTKKFPIGYRYIKGYNGNVFYTKNHLNEIYVCNENFENLVKYQASNRYGQVIPLYINGEDYLWIGYVTANGAKTVITDFDNNKILEGNDGETIFPYKYGMSEIFNEQDDEQFIKLIDLNGNVISDNIETNSLQLCATTAKLKNNSEDNLAPGKYYFYSDNTKEIYLITISYRILGGANSVVDKNTEKNLLIKTDGDKEKVEGIYVNNVKLETDKFTLQTGSTIVTVKNSYLKTLEEKEHTLKVKYVDGEVETKFTITNKQQNPPDNDPTTGDDNNKVKDETPKTGIANNNMSSFLFVVVGLIVCIIPSSIALRKIRK